MNLIESIKSYFESLGISEIEFSEIRQKPGGKYTIFVDLVHPENGKGRIRFSFLIAPDKSQILSVVPMKRFFESELSWDSTVKNVHSIYSGIPGISGVSNRNVNRSII